MDPCNSQAYLVKHHCIFEPWCTWKYSVTSQTPAYMGLKKGEEQGKEGERVPLVNFGTVSSGWWTGKLAPGCLANTGQVSLANEGLHPVYWGSSVHPGQMVTWNKFKDFGGIEFTLVPYDFIIKGIKQEIIEINMFLFVKISTPLHPPRQTLLCPHSMTSWWLVCEIWNVVWPITFFSKKKLFIWHSELVVSQAKLVCRKNDKTADNGQNHLLVSVWRYIFSFVSIYVMVTKINKCTSDIKV